jgi:acyl carrier protein
VTPQQVELIVRSIVGEILGYSFDDNEGLDLPYQEAGLDSLDAVEILLDVEQEFEIEIDDEEVEGLNTMRDVINYVVKKKGLSNVA